MDTWRYLSCGDYDAFENMAIDEAIFIKTQQEETRPTLRFYRWICPSVSLGYFQHPRDEINVEFCRERNIPVVRRPTGGKAVFHENDLTYSVVARQSYHLFSGGLLATYRVISGCIAAGLVKVGIKADMLEEGRDPKASGMEAFCFSVPSQYELLVEGKKICGSAQVRARGSFLQHGSLLIAFDPRTTCMVMGTDANDDEGDIAYVQRHVTAVRDLIHADIDEGELCRYLAAGFEEQLGIRLENGSLTVEEETLKEDLLRNKYTTHKWNMEGKAVEWRYNT